MSLRKNRGKEIISSITLQNWEEYFERLLNEDRSEFIQAQENQSVNFIGFSITLRVVEITEVCKTSKCGRAPGPGDIPGELLKNGLCELFEHLKTLLQKCVDPSQTPRECKILYMTPIFKKDDRSKFENYRGIAVTSMMSRVKF